MTDTFKLTTLLLLVTILLAVLLTGCDYEPSIEVYEAPNGDICKESRYDYNKCGMYLWDCQSGYSYNCVQNMKVIHIT